MKPKYDDTWDPNPVLQFLGKQHPSETLSLEQHVTKLVTLLALITAHRVQTLAKIRLSNITEHPDRLEIRIPEKIKTTGRNRLQPLLKIPTFPNNPELCLATCIQTYIKRTSHYRKNTDALILTHKKPYHAASSQTISRWIKIVIKASGIDTNKYSGHSTRHAATSAAKRAGVSVEEIRKRAGWSQKSNVFANFYNRPLETAHDFFAKGVLKGSGLTP